MSELGEKEKLKFTPFGVYIKVDDIEAKVKLIEENGGFIVDPPLDLPNGSRICLFNEPSGVTLAMVHAAKK